MATSTADLRTELEVVRRRLDDHGTVQRKTQQALNELAESVGKLVESQRRRERWLNVNSFGAYLLFTLVLGGAFLTLYRSRAKELVRGRDAAVGALDDANRKASDLEAQLAARNQGSERAFAYYKLLQDGKRVEAVSQYGELDPASLTPTERDVFAEGHKKAREELVDAGYLGGLDAARSGDNAKAITELRKALAYEDEGPRAAQMRYYLGVALVKTGEAEKARHELELALAGRVEQTGAVDARYWLASALEAMGELDLARTEYERFASSQPQHPLSVAARRKAMVLARKTVPTN
ncbi:MAG TPA: tetratricopeptide repeat protein [Kofleriaceae bacterium]|nr:tetratricopeptide repeat protein [Kofleriaceae bacterium]